MKILFVEDELKKNVTGVIELFEKYLGAELIRELENARDDDWASNEDIKKVVEKCGLIEVAYSFPQAVKVVKNNCSDYSLFVVDCNLSEQPYNKNELETIAPEFGDDQKHRYNQREGEYLLLLLSKEEKEIKEKFYFLSAYSPSNNVLGLIDNGTIARDNYIEKGSAEDKKRLITQVINRNVDLDIRLKNMEYLDILKMHLSDRATNRLMSILKSQATDMTSDMIVSTMANIRNLMQNICTKIAIQKAAPAICWNPKNKTQLSVRPFIGWLTKYNQDSKYQFYSNTLIENHLYNIQGIASDHASHEELIQELIHINGYKPTANTVNTLIFALKDIILWYGQITEKK